MAIIRAIVKGERDPAGLAKYREPGCRKSAQEIAEQLSGHWREDHLFSLEQSLKMYDSIQERIQAFDTEIQRRLAEMQRAELKDQQPPPLKNKNKAKLMRLRGEEPMREGCFG
jgi:transposase